MFDIGWTELVVIGVVMILVVGPKDLPVMLRSFGRTVRGLRRMAGDFQRQFDDALREAELDDVKKLANSKTLKPLEDARKTVQNVQRQVNDGLNETVKLDAPGAGRAQTSADEKPATKETAAKPAEASSAKPKADGPKQPPAKAAKKPASKAKSAGNKAGSRKTGANA